MKVAVSATGKDLDSSIDERFGRCPYYLIIETDNMSNETLENTNADLSSSAGIQSAALVASKGVEAVITGNCGPKAMQVFDTANIAVLTGQRGTIRTAVEQYKSSLLQPSAGGNVSPTKATDPAKLVRNAVRSGVPGGGRGMGGRGRGMGGCGRGMGMGRRCNRPYDATSPATQRSFGNISKEDELERLRQQADELKQQLQVVQSRIKALA
jgi:predicted Fe-Mo cluster-binding NifX family protein